MTIHEELASAWAAAGLQVVKVEAASGKRSAPNPTRITLQTGPSKTVTYTVFAWRITHEGKGRIGNNLRIQATSFGKGNSPVQVDRFVLGIGWSDDQDLFVAFDPWVKRNPGSSSSVHIKRALVEQAATDGVARGGFTWDPRFAFTHPHAAQHLAWANSLWKRRTLSVKALSQEQAGPDTIIVEVDPWSSPAGWGVREKDRLGLFDAAGENPDDYLWRVRDIGEKPIDLTSGRNRFHYMFTAKRSARRTGDLEQP